MTALEAGLMLALIIVIGLVFVLAVCLYAQNMAKDIQISKLQHNVQQLKIVVSGEHISFKK